jgi:hypothetical protein
VRRTSEIRLHKTTEVDNPHCAKGAGQVIGAALATWLIAALVAMFGRWGSGDGAQSSAGSFQ